MRDDIFGGRLARAARNGNHLSAPSSRAQTASCCRAAANRTTTSCLPTPASPLHHHRDCALLERRSHIIVPVVIRTAKREEQISRIQRARIDAPAGN